MQASSLTDHQKTRDMPVDNETSPSFRQQNVESVRELTH